MKTKVSLLIICLLLFSCNSESKKKNFVSIKNGKFYLNNKPFYPITINYVLSLQGNDKNEVWPSSNKNYYNDDKYKYTTNDSSLLELKGDFDLIKGMGFNTIRLGVEPIISKKNGELLIPCQLGNGKDIPISLSSEEGYDKYFGALAKLFYVINKSGLKVIFLTRLFIDEPSTDLYLRKLVTRFRNDTTILAYDFFNEPLYFDRKEREKREVYDVVSNWRKIMHINAPNQMCTIGLEGIREVFEWDPGILDVDFISFHPYEYESEQVRNEIYWYGKYIKKPWIIGETAIPADNDSVSYEDQRLFAHKTINQAYNCGAAGYSWWQFKDVEWYSYHANFMGVLSREGETKTKNNWMVTGTIKPVAIEFKNFDSNSPKDTCICLNNYYNYSQFHNCRILGKMIDEESNSIEGGVILAWKQDWSSSYHTITKKDGSFELLGNFPFAHWMASASTYSMVRGDVMPNCEINALDHIPTFNIGVLQIEKLPFAN